jgi:hypothetical protein
MPMRISAQDSRHHADSEDDERETDQAFGPMVEALRQAHVQLENGDSQRRNGKGVSQRIRHAETESASPIALHSGDV